MRQRVEYESGTFNVDYRLGADMVIFCHGFGVNTDGHGLIPALIEALPADCGYVSFDFCDSYDNGRHIIVKSFADEQQRYKAVVQWARSQSEVRRLHIVAHGLGGIVAASGRAGTFASLTLLAPPVNVAAEIHYLSAAYGAVERAGIWKLKRPDGSGITLPASFIHEATKIDAEGLLLRLSRWHEYTLILPSNDEVLADDDYTGLIVEPAVHTLSVADTNHYFEGAGRSELLQLIKTLSSGKSLDNSAATV